MNLRDVVKSAAIELAMVRLGNHTLGTSRQFGPPRRVTTLRQAALLPQNRYTACHVSYDPDWSGLAYDDGQPVDFQVPLPEQFPEAGILETPDGRVLDVHGWSVTSEDALLGDATFIHEEERFQHYREILRLKKPHRMNGVTLNLGSAFCANNYGHTLLDSLSRIALLRKAGMRLSDIDAVLISPFRTRTTDRVLRLAGIDPAQLLELHPREHIQSDRMIITSFPGTPRCYPSWVPGFFRSLLPPPVSRKRRLFVVRRGGRRALRNLDEVLTVAARYGFEAYDPMAPGSSADDFAQAEIVMGGHGAGLSDIVFCHPGTQMVEFLPSRNRFPYFATASASAGLKYVAIPCQSLDGSDHADYSVDPTRLDRLLKQFG